MFVPPSAFSCVKSWQPGEGKEPRSGRWAKCSSDTNINVPHVQLTRTTSGCAPFKDLSAPLHLHLALITSSTLDVLRQFRPPSSAGFSVVVGECVSDVITQRLSLHFSYWTLFLLLAGLRAAPAECVWGHQLFKSIYMSPITNILPGAISAFHYSGCCLSVLMRVWKYVLKWYPSIYIHIVICFRCNFLTLLLFRL